MIKDNKLALVAILFLTIIAFGVIIFTYHNKLREPLGKLLQEFE